MRGTRHWLDGVIDVLRADTADLRALARIAGEDPATLYIGTALDGVDLRGQDLRGMRFTHLDLRRVQHDERTLLDALPEPPPQEASTPDLKLGPDVRGLVLYEDIVNTVLPLRRDVGDGLLLYADPEEFRAAAERYDGPKFVVLEHSRLLGLEKRLKPFDADTVTLVARHGPLRAPRAGELAAAEAIPGPVISVPMSSLARRAGSNALSGPLLDALLLFTENWSLVRDRLPGGRLSVFLRALGRGPEARSEGWCRIFSLATRAELAGYAGLRLQQTGPRTETNDASGQALFPEWSSEMVHLPPGARNPISSAALIHPYGYHRPNETAYADGVLRLLELNGWNFKLASARAEGVEAEIQGEHWKRPILAWSRIEPSNRAPTQVDANLRQMWLEDPVLIVMAENANERATLYHFALDRWLLASTSDLRHFNARSRTIWPLIAQQSLRLVRSSDAAGRTRYLSVLIRAALRADAVGGGDPSRLIDALNDHEFAQGYVLAVDEVEAYAGAAVYHLTMMSRHDRVAFGPPAGNLSFELAVDDGGPVLRNFQLLL